jgi:hypothetical protein
VAVGLTSDQAEATSWAKRMGYAMPVGYTASEMLAPNGLRGVPAVLLVDGDGMVKATLTGFHRGPALADEIQKVLLPR